MSKLHYITPTGQLEDVQTVRLAATGSANQYTKYEEGKAVKLAASDRYDLCAAGDKIEGFISSVEQSSAGGFSIGGIINEGHVFATADGLEATAGTGTIAVGDFVVAGTITAKGTGLTAYPKVCKATVQPGVAIVSTVGGADTAAAVKVVLDAALVKVAAGQMAAMYGWRCVSTYTAGTGAVGTTIVLERVGA